jgi:two-component system, OmpR family, phosphate regulon sensor histidine kinase PhoR
MSPRRARPPSAAASRIIRSLWLSWTLFAVAAAALGGASLALVWRESERAARLYADAATARASTIAENAALISAEIKASVMDSLAALPESGLAGELLRWREENQFVAEVLLISPNGRWVLPEGSASSQWRQALREADGSYPWNLELVSRMDEAAPAAQAEETRAEPDAVASGNYARVDQARSQLRQQTQAPFLQERSRAANAAELSADSYSEAAMASGAERSVATRSPPAAARQRQAAAEPPPAAEPASSGWIYRSIEGGPVWIGWFRMGTNGETRAVVLNSEMMTRQLGAAFPSQLQPGETFALRDASGRTVEQRGTRGSLPSGDPLMSVAVGPELPGWTLVGYENGLRSLGGSFLALGSLFVGLVTLAMLTGGTLLLRQARRDSLDAARKTTFVANVSHELKTPLTSIRLYAELLADERTRDEAKRHRYLHTILAETQRLTRLVNNVLDFSRLERGRREYRIESVELSSWLANWLELHEPRVAAAGMSLVKDLTSSVLGQIERDSFEQVLLNLIDNAIKYAAAGGEIRISLEEIPGGGFAHVVVADRGPGIPREHRDRIFEMFQRVDDSLAASQAGCGLGLAIARRLMREQGGDLLCEPNQPNGSRFVVVVPLAVGNKAGSSAALSPQGDALK